MIRRERGESGRAEQRHGAPHFDCECPQHVSDAGFARDGEAVEVRPPDHAGPCAEGERLHDVGTPPRAAVDDDLDGLEKPAFKRREHLKRRERAVELSTP